MIEESVKAVKEAEAKALELVSDAKKKADAIVQEARRDAEQILADVEVECRKAQTDRMDAAKAEGEKALAEAEAESAKDVEALKTLTEGRMADAKKAVIRELVG